MTQPAYGLTFESFAPVTRTDHFRADVALFVGYVAARRSERPALQAPLWSWLRGQGFRAARTAPGGALTAIEAHRAAGRSIAELVQVPIPIESWDTFTKLFAWQERPLREGFVTTSYLGAAVRAFFAQGGRKCYVVRAGDPWMKFEDLDDRAAELRKAVLVRRREDRLAELVPQALPGPAPTPLERATWRGIAHVFGLADVAFVLVPDLPDLFDTRARMDIPPPDAEVPEAFVDCSLERVAAPRPGREATMPPPMCDEEALSRWTEVVSAAAEVVRRHRSEAELVVALPLALDGTALAPRPSQENPLALLYRLRALRARQDAADRPAVASFTSAFVQLGYPWLRTIGSGTLIGDLEPPDGTLAGILARNALTRGTFRSAAGLQVPFVYDLVPDLGGSTLIEPIADPAGLRDWNALQRLSVVGRSPAGIDLLSDVSTSADESYRSAGAARLIGAMLRAARAIGEDMAFEASSEALWSRLRGRMEAMLLELWHLGALRGRSAADAYQVRCDRSTMSQADIDEGRVIVLVQMEVAVAVESLRVALALTEGGRVSLLSMGGDE
jgi:uncharacterized protein